MKFLKSLWIKEIAMTGWDGKNIVTETVQISHVRYAFIIARVQLKLFVYEIKSLIGKG